MRLRFRISRHRWVDILIQVVVGVGLIFLSFLVFRWLARDGATLAKPVQLSADEMVVRLLESGEAPDASEFEIRVSASRGDVEFAPTAGVAEWIPLYPAGFEAVPQELLSDGEIKGALVHPGQDPFEETLTVSLAPSFIHPTEAFHDSLPIGIPMRVGKLVVAIGFRVGDQQEHESIPVPVEIIRTAIPQPATNEPPKLALVCGAVDCDEDTGSALVSCSAVDDVSQPEQLEYRARVDEDSWSDWSSQTDYTFDALANGIHLATIQVRDEDANLSEGECQLGVDCPGLPDGPPELGQRTTDEPLQPLVAWFEPWPTAPIAGDTLLLDASGSASPNGALEVFEWDVDGDGINDYVESSPTLEHLFALSGEKAVSLRVTDTRSGSGSVFRILDVELAGSSSAGTPEDLSAGLFAVFQGSTVLGVHPVKGGNSARTFYDYRSEQANTGFEESEAAVLFLYETSAGQVYLFVLLGSSSGPGGTASLQATLSSGPVGIEFTDDRFDIRDTTRMGRDSAFFTWVWDAGTGDGAILGPLTAPYELELNPKFLAGIRRVVFLSEAGPVIEATELSLNDPLTIASSGRESPQAHFMIRPASVRANMTATLDASASSTPAGLIEEYAWDYEGDGLFDRRTEAAVHTHVFRSPGEKRVTLRVTNSEGAMAWMTVPVGVMP